MAGARPPRRDSGDPGGGVSSWLVLDLADSGPGAEAGDLGEALAELSQAVAGITVLAGPGRLTEVGSVAPADTAIAVVEAGEPGSAARLRRAEAGVPEHVDVLVYGDAQLLAADYRCSVADALALLADRDVALVRGIPVTDSLRRVDERDRLRGCVDREQLFVLQKPQVIRREAVSQIAELAAYPDADGSVEAGLLRFPWPVRVVDIYPTATTPSETPAAPTRS
jgi:hypothetical protein